MATATGGTSSAIPSNSSSTNINGGSGAPLVSKSVSSSGGGGGGSGVSSVLATAVSKEMEQIIRKLEQGSTLIKFYPKGRPEKKQFCMKLDTRQIVWLRPGTARSVIENSADLREV